ncbi:hypothetical protein ABIA35_007977 [Catenulispora sp. MAP12-49]|uniref:hypothetical protein n=1 Tax=Catenulispora sp. MAP12-49 TaxID=3156302 RepID=UPI00351708BC
MPAADAEDWSGSAVVGRLGLLVGSLLVGSAAADEIAARWIGSAFAARRIGTAAGAVAERCIGAAGAMLPVSGVAAGRCVEAGIELRTAGGVCCVGTLLGGVGAERWTDGPAGVATLLKTGRTGSGRLVRCAEASATSPTIVRVTSRPPSRGLVEVGGFGAGDRGVFSRTGAVWRVDRVLDAGLRCTVAGAGGVAGETAAGVGAVVGDCGAAGTSRAGLAAGTAPRRWTARMGMACGVDGTER